MSLPSFLIKKTPKLKNIRKIRSIIGNDGLHTVCEKAFCPNIGECFSQGVCAFLILGDTCTRNCAFCGVNKGIPSSPKTDEPKIIAAAAKKLKLEYIVITSVTRDDLPDGGAAHFAETIKELSRDKIAVEVLIPDFNGSRKSLETVLDALPYVLNHNVETVPRLYPQIRPQANYRQSLAILHRAKERNIYTKSGFMVGLGESGEEVRQVLLDLRGSGCDVVTIGQYLPPSKSHFKVERYVSPAEFEEYKIFGEKLGLKIAAGPFVRSSYRAKEIINGRSAASG